MTNSQLCGAPTKGGTPCRNPVSNNHWRRHCNKHWCFGSHGPLRKRLARAEEAPTPAGRRSGKPPELSADDRWVREVDRRGRALAGIAEWEQFKAETSHAGCQFLADLANTLKEVRTLTKRGIGDAVARLLGDSRPVERYIAEQCAIRVIDLHLGSAAGLVPALRALGIFSCVVSNRPLAKCPCFTDWWDAERKETMKTALSTALPSVG
jgi:hypothetical protein